MNFIVFIYLVAMIILCLIVLVTYINTVSSLEIDRIVVLSKGFDHI